MRLSIGLALCAALAAFALPAAAQTLKVGVRAPVVTIDPGHNNVASDNSLKAQIFGTLIRIDPTGHLVPGLAERWKPVGPDTWEFKLRDAEFQNGAPFTAQDVVFSINRLAKLPDRAGSFAAYVKPIANIEVVDAHTIRIRTRTMFPLLPAYLTQLFIVSHTAAAGATEADFNSGKAAIGTGPFRLVSFQPGDHVELARNDHYWGKKPYWKTIDYRIMPNNGARAAALINGDVQFIDAVPTEDIALLRRNKRIKLWEALGTRVIFLELNQSDGSWIRGLSGPNDGRLDKNPLRDRRVRQALSEAINRNAIVARAMNGAAEPAGQFVPPGTFGHAPSVKPPPYDPAAAKKLLAAAGFPDGFRIMLAGPDDHYMNDSAVIQAVGQMWQRIGMQASVQPLPWSVYAPRAGRRSFPAFLFGWNSVTAEAADPLIAEVATYDKNTGFGAANYGRYTNPALDKLIGQAVAAADDAKREKLLRDATIMAMRDVAVIPLFIQKNVWATRAGLTYVPGVEQRLRLTDVRPAK